jgi:hypothetical protein
VVTGCMLLLVLLVRSVVHWRLLLMHWRMQQQA